MIICYKIIKRRYYIKRYERDIFYIYRLKL